MSDAGTGYSYPGSEGDEVMPRDDPVFTRLLNELESSLYQKSIRAHDYLVSSDDDAPMCRDMHEEASSRVDVARDDLHRYVNFLGYAARGDLRRYLKSLGGLKRDPK